ncbi:hypothetical protein JZU46_05375, partial [bacterium]|nr:hypothetical protein [bacterium]
ANATLTVGKADQTITLDAIANINLVDFEGNPIPVVAEASSGLPVTLSLAEGSVATLNGTQLESTIATGNVTVYANQAGNASYNAATQVGEAFAVTKANQAITFDALPLKHVGDADFALTASSTSDLLISYASATPGVVSINGKIVTVHTTGSSDITASQPGNEYYNAASSVMQAQVVEGELFKNWTGALSTVWDVAGNWNPSGVPVSTDNLIIGSTANQPHITNVGGAVALSNKLAINSGATLVVDAGKALTVNGVLTNSGSMLIESSADGTGSLITNSSITNTGTINVQRYITNEKWHLISSPLTSATAFIFKDDYLQSWDETEAKWTDIVLTSTGLNPQEGYGLWTMQAAAHSYTFTGTPNTGDQSKSITYTEVPFGENNGANLFGNPYPSSIDWSGLDDTYGAVYYWLGSGTDGSGTYVSYNNSIGSGSRYIPPMQGFFIVAEAAGTFSLTNSDRVHSTASYYKTSNAVQDKLLVLETVSKGISDKLYLKFDESAEEGFELRNDAYKFSGYIDGVSELYSLSGDKKLSIDVRPACDVVELGFTNTRAGEYQIGLSEVNGFDEAMLEDAHTGTFTDLLNKSYTFSYVPGEPTQRFKLHFTTILSAGDKKDVAAIIYSYRKTAYINLK